MKTSRTFSLSLLFLCFALISGCNGVGTAEVAGIGANTADGPAVAVFSGIDSIDEVTDSTVRLNWNSHPDAVAYDIFDVTSGQAVWIKTVQGQSSNSTVLTDLSPGSQYKFRVRAKSQAGVNDNNSKSQTVGLNVAPDAPSAISIVSPVTSPNFTSPIISVSGVKKGDVVKLFSDNNCSTELASAEANDSTIEFDLSTIEGGEYNFYANATNINSNASPCSSTTVAFEKLACPADKGEFIPVPANPTLGTDNFCVMKYEAKCEGTSCPTGTPTIYARATSKAAGAPWNNIKIGNSMIACQNMGPGYDLISNMEWMAIARNIETEPANWVDGYTNQGWHAHTADGFTNSNYAPSTGPGCLYNTGANTCGATGNHKFKRTHILSNNEEIWDLAGNIEEWVDWEIEEPNIVTLGPTTCAYGWGNIQAKITACSSQTPNIGNGLPDVSDVASPLDTSLNSLHNIGQLHGGAGGATLRGGHYGNLSKSGIYNLDFNTQQIYSYPYRGFRCVYRH